MYICYLQKTMDSNQIISGKINNENGTEIETGVLLILGFHPNIFFDYFAFFILPALTFHGLFMF